MASFIDPHLSAFFSHLVDWTHSDAPPLSHIIDWDPAESAPQPRATTHAQEPVATVHTPKPRIVADVTSDKPGAAPRAVAHGQRIKAGSLETVGTATMPALPRDLTDEALRNLYKKYADANNVDGFSPFRNVRAMREYLREVRTELAHRLAGQEMREFTTLINAAKVEQSDLHAVCERFWSVQGMDLYDLMAGLVRGLNPDQLSAFKTSVNTLREQRANLNSNEPLWERHITNKQLVFVRDFHAWHLASGEFDTPDAKLRHMLVGFDIVASARQRELRRTLA
jgi:hypothetical protein